MPVPAATAICRPCPSCCAKSSRWWCTAGCGSGTSLVQRLVAATRELVQRNPGADGGAVCDLSALSEREAQVARAVAQGRSNKEVAEQLFISERTVKAHLGAIFDKLGVRDRVQLVLKLQSSFPAVESGGRL